MTISLLLHVLAALCGALQNLLSRDVTRRWTSTFWKKVVHRDCALAEDVGFVAGECLLLFWLRSCRVCRCCFSADHVRFGSGQHQVCMLLLLARSRCVCYLFGSDQVCMLLFWLRSRCVCCLFGSDHVCTVVLAQITLCLLLVWLRSCCVCCWFGSDHFVSAVVVAQIMCVLLFWTRSCVYCCFASDHVSAVGLAQIMCVLLF